MDARKNNGRMRARNVNEDSFTRGGNPYRKLRIGRYGKPDIIAMDDLADKVFFHWDVYFDDGRAGIEQETDGGRQMMWLKTDKLNSLGKQNRKKFITELTQILQDSDIYTDVVVYEYYQITIFPKWKG